MTASAISEVTAPDVERAANRRSQMAEGLVGSEILRIASEIRAMVAAGREIVNLTVGDFAPAEFRIPPSLERGIFEALQKGETNYPPSDGVLTLRAAIARLAKRSLALDVATEHVLVTSGARPAIYAAYRALVDSGDRVVYPLPSWNNNHYCHLTGAVGVGVACAPEDDFLPTARSLRQALRGARMLVLNSPANPTGTVFTAARLGEICDSVLEENTRRGSAERPLYVLYDQVYWMLELGARTHATPAGERPAIFDYTVLVDGISKPFAATGLRVGWAIGPADLIERMSAIVGHVGAWAPKPEQVATAALLDEAAVLQASVEAISSGVHERLGALYDAIASMTRDGLPVRAIAPAGAIYCSMQIDPDRDLPGIPRPRTNEDTRRWLLERAGVAVVPFQAFGMPGESGWFRLSVGAVSVEDIRRAMARLRDAMAG